LTVFLESGKVASTTTTVNEVLMRKIVMMFVFSMLQASVLAAQTGPALVQLDAMSLVKISDIGPKVSALSAVPQAEETLILINTQTGETHGVIPVSGGFLHVSNGQLVASVYNGSGYLLQTGQYWPVVGKQRVLRGVKPPLGDRWGAIVEKALAYGLITEDDWSVPGSRYLDDFAGPNDGSHKADYFSIWGYTGQGGEFFPDSVTMVSENWEITQDGNWRIDQWIHSVDLDGTAQKVSHTVLSETMDGQILDMQTETLGPGDPRAEESRNGLIEKWDLYVPAKILKF
jgi:hypothetical protein